MKRLQFFALAMVSCAVVFLGRTLRADPCGLVPPVWVQKDQRVAPTIRRVNVQMTYVFYRDKLETIVIRPTFEGTVDQFGMLVPFPTPPEMRKVSEDIFDHIAAAIDPPEVVHDVRPSRFVGGFGGGGGGGFGGGGGGFGGGGIALRQDEVRVLKEEGIGMYEVAVLAAGSSGALKKWMKDHSYRYPKGMDNVCDNYINKRWCFVAVRARIGSAQRVAPRPGMKEVDAKKPAGATFEGHVQAMEFRFTSDKLVVPMRLSAFNEGKLRNIVFLLTDGPKRIRSIPEEYVVRQVSGERLFRNLTKPLPLRIIGGVAADVSQKDWKWITTARDPSQYSHKAAELFGSDLLALKKRKLAHPLEERAKQLGVISERLDLRGPEIDQAMDRAVNSLGPGVRRHKLALQKSLEAIRSMTMTVVDGDFPREIIARENLTFANFRMAHRKNKSIFYNCLDKKPGGAKSGRLYLGAIEIPSDRLQVSTERSSSENDSTGDVSSGSSRLGSAAWTSVAAVLLVVGQFWFRRRRGPMLVGLILVTFLIGIPSDQRAVAESDEKDDSRITQQRANQLVREVVEQAAKKVF